MRLKKTQPGKQQSQNNHNFVGKPDSRHVPAPGKMIRIGKSDLGRCSAGKLHAIIIFQNFLRPRVAAIRRRRHDDDDDEKQQAQLRAPMPAHVTSAIERKCLSHECGEVPARASSACCAHTAVPKEQQQQTAEEKQIKISELPTQPLIATEIVRRPMPDSSADIDRKIHSGGNESAKQIHERTN